MMLDDFDAMMEALGKRLSAALGIPVYYYYKSINCPCCGSDSTVLVDVAFEVATGREVVVGDTRQCERCLAYFVPGEGCDNPDLENFTP